MKNFIKKLDSLNFTSYSDRELVTDDGWKLNYHVDLHDSFSDIRFQVVVRLSYQGEYVTSYGCTTLEETNEFGDWFIRSKAKATENDCTKRTKLQKTGKALFESL